MPGLDALLGRFAAGADAHYLVAVNETPPSDTGTFFMRPRVDRRWSRGGFGGPPPRWTTVVFLDFPAEGRGGELVVFPPETLASGTPVLRAGARGFTLVLVGTAGVQPAILEPIKLLVPEVLA